MDKVAIVIVHYKGEDDTRECLDSIRSSHPQSKQYYIIVVVNPTSESKVAKQENFFVTNLQKSYPQILIVQNKINTGFAQGNNIGIKKAFEVGCEYVLLLNNDTVVSAKVLDKLISFAHSDARIGLVSPKIYFAKGFEYHKNRYKNAEKGKVIWYAGGDIDWNNIYARHRGVDEVDKGQYDDVVETDFATGCCMLIKRSTIEKVGLFDANYFLYYEDLDLSLRVKKNGMKVIYYPKAILWHKNASSSGKPGSSLHVYYQTRNRLYFGFRYAPVRAKKALFFESMKFLFKDKIYQKAVFDYYLGKMGRADI